MVLRKTTAKLISKNVGYFYGDSLPMEEIYTTLEFGDEWRSHEIRLAGDQSEGFQVGKSYEISVASVIDVSAADISV